MILVMMMLIIFISISFYYSFDFNAFEHEEQNDELITVLNYYQTMASSKGASIITVFPPNSNQILFYSPKLNLKARYKLKRSSIYEGNTVKEIMLTPEGVNKGASIIYRTDQTYYKLIIQLYRGRIRIEKLETAERLLITGWHAIVIHHLFNHFNAPSIISAAKIYIPERTG